MKRVFNAVLRRSNIIPDPSVRSVVSRFAAAGVYGVVGTMSLSALGFDCSPLMATLGVTGATIGFASKDVGANLVAGIALAVQRPFQTGSRLRVGTGVVGEVHHWDLRYLYLRGDDGELIFVPNSIVFSNVIAIENPPEDCFAHDPLAPQEAIKAKTLVEKWMRKPPPVTSADKVKAKEREETERKEKAEKEKAEKEKAEKEKADKEKAAKTAAPKK